MIERNYNGTGKWTVEAVQIRYKEYAARFGVEATNALVPKTYESEGVRWVYPIMDEVIDGIEKRDPACTLIGIEFIEEDSRFPFGAGLKSRTARALRRATLSSSQRARIRKRVVNMLKDGNTPREYKEYAKLLRKIGVEQVWKQIESSVPRNNKYAMRYYDYFQAIKEHSSAVERYER